MFIAICVDWNVGNWWPIFTLVMRHLMRPSLVKSPQLPVNHLFLLAKSPFRGVKSLFILVLYQIRDSSGPCWSTSPHFYWISIMFTETRPRSKVLRLYEDSWDMSQLKISSAAQWWARNKGALWVSKCQSYSVWKWGIFPFPHHVPCMEYLPTFARKITQM